MFSFLQGFLLLYTSSICAAQQYSPPQYEVHDDGESPQASSGKGSDYSKYYASETNADAQAAVQDSGFVRPIDFSSLFGANGVGFGGGAAGSNQVFRPSNSDVNTFALPLSQGISVFPAELQGSATKNEEAGFTSPNVKFPSLFDATGSASEIGFRPQDFLKKSGANDDDKISEGTTVIGNTGFYSPAFTKLDSEYNVNPGPHYSHRAIPAAAEQYPKKSSYKAESEEQEDSGEYRPTSSSSDDKYDEKPNYKTPPSESYSYKPTTYKSSKPEYAEGKSSYPSPSERYTFKPVLTAPTPEYVKSNYRASATGNPSQSSPSEYYPSKTSYRPSATEQHKTKSTYSSPAPLDIYGKISTYTPLPTEQREGKLRYSPSAEPEIIYGKGKAPVYQPLASEPHQGKSSYPTAFSKDIYNDKYVAKPSPTSQSKFYDNPSIPYSTGSDPSVPYTKSISTTVGSPTNTEETYQEEPAGHGPPEYAPSGSKTDKKTCKKIQKRLSADDVATGRFRRDAMTCYQCEDPKTGGTYEKCSYTSDPNSNSYFVGHAQKYSTDTSNKPKSYRYRRYLSRDPFGIEAEEEELLAAETRSRVIRQDSGYSYSSTGHDDKGDYNFGPEFFTDSSDDFITEYKPSGATIDEKHCKKAGHMNSALTRKSLRKITIFLRTKHLHPSGKPYTERQTGYEKPEGAASYYEPHSRHTRQEPSKSVKNAGETKSQPESEIEKKFGIPYDLAASTRRETTTNLKPGVGLDPYLYGEAEKYNPKTVDKTAEGTEQHDSYFPGGKSYDEYFRHLFPELHEEGKGSASSDSESYEYPSSTNTNSDAKVPSFEYKTSLPEYFTDTEQKKDLEKVLGEFTQKDRSSCKKVVKDKMTCYKCVDKKGMQHEECMFVAASEPKSSHLAYHEVKEFRLVPKPGVGDGKESASSNLPVASDSVSSSSSDNKRTTETKDKTTEASTTVLPKQRRKTFFKKVASSSTTPTPVADNKYDETAQLDLFKVSQKPSSNAKSPRVVKVTRRSSKTAVLTTTTTTLTTPAPPEKNEKLAKITDSNAAGSEKHETKIKKSKVAPPEPELSASDLSPDGHYTSETKTRYDPVLKVHLPEYMLSRSEHEAIFDEVMASGRRR
ncbi:hypothetical protein L9F63_023669 [Diploptera punctata]|uniref:Uncharacterized protein n=1 Tax=Diploptera punctata TaxID=6984 RepID=A0AAD7ZI72_DIPPU|nr:hypothetical protein L9F63_023669 [Diploptera punctata]